MIQTKRWLRKAGLSDVCFQTAFSINYIDFPAGVDVTNTVGKTEPGRGNAVARERCTRRCVFSLTRIDPRFSRERFKSAFA